MALTPEELEHLTQEVTPPEGFIAVHDQRGWTLRYNGQLLQANRQKTHFATRAGAIKSMKACWHPRYKTMQTLDVYRKARGIPNEDWYTPAQRRQYEEFIDHLILRGIITLQLE